jgi:hypothetical protein
LSGKGLTDTHARDRPDEAIELRREFLPALKDRLLTARDPNFADVALPIRMNRI